MLKMFTLSNPAGAIALRRIATILSVAIVTLTLTAALSGILLSFYYEPTAGGAFNSLKFINTEVANGWLIRSVHKLAGNFIIVLGLIEMVVLFLGRRFQPAWLTAWVTGIFSVLTGIGLGWTAMLLDWSQEGYWRFRIELDTIAAIPLVGSQLRDILTGGVVNSITVQHLYTLHSYVLAVAVLSLAIIQLVSLLWQEKFDRQSLATLALETGEQVTAE